MELDFKAIGKRIKIARIKKELTQEAVSEKVGVTPQHMSNIETGNSTVSLPTLFSREAQAILDDCNEYEIRFLVDVMKSVKASMRNVKMFEQRIESKNI